MEGGVGREEWAEEWEEEWAEERGVEWGVEWGGAERGGEVGIGVGAGVGDASGDGNGCASGDMTGGSGLTGRAVVREGWGVGVAGMWCECCVSEGGTARTWASPTTRQTPRGAPSADGTHQTPKGGRCRR